MGDTKKEIRAKMQKLEDRFDKGEISEDVFKMRYRNLEKDLEEVRRQKQKAKKNKSKHKNDNKFITCKTCNSKVEKEFWDIHKAECFPVKKKEKRRENTQNQNQDQGKIECKHCYKKVTPRLWHIRVWFSYMKTQHLCPFCGKVMYETGGEPHYGIIFASLLFPPMWFVMIIVFSYRFSKSIVEPAIQRQAEEYKRKNP